MTPDELERVSQFLKVLTKASADFGVELNCVNPYVSVKGHETGTKEWVGQLGWRAGDNGELVYTLEETPR